MEYITIILLVLMIILNIILVIKSNSNNKSKENLDNSLKELKDYSNKNQKDTLDFLERQLNVQNQNQKNIQELEGKRFDDFNINIRKNIEILTKSINDTNSMLDNRFNNLHKVNEEKLEQIRTTLESKVNSMQLNNEKKLEEMRATVDEKLQSTLETRISQSFKLVSDRLDKVYTSLGEMQKLSNGVDDLKRVLSNVKTRGILGEVQLGAILEQILNTDQYDTNVITKKGTNDRVEYAVKLPGENGEFVYLPIDAKFPMDAYQNLLDAYDSSNQAEVEAAAKVLTSRIKLFAKDISSKYIDVPNTTDFGIMFLPVEGLYAEVVRRGMVEELQKLKINIAGPTTMAALLNSLQMGFKTLAIQKSSSQVWQVLEGVKSEFTKFGDVLGKTQDRMRQASEELDKLVGTRTTAINRKLKDVLITTSSNNLLEDKEFIDVI